MATKSVAPKESILYHKIQDDLDQPRLRSLPKWARLHILALENTVMKMAVEVKILNKKVRDLEGRVTNIDGLEP